MKLKNILLFLFVSVTTFKATAQSADEIINDYFTAIGGHDKIAQINSESMEGTFEVMGNTGKSTITILNGKGYKSVIDFSGQSLIQVVTDKGGWMVNPFMGSPDPAAMPEEQYLPSKGQINIGGPLFDYKNNGASVQYIGTESVAGKPAFKIQALTKDSVKYTYYIDSATHYNTQVAIEYNGQITTAKYSDFRKTDFGIMMPYAEELTVPQGMQLTYTLTRVETNKPVEPAIFDMPAKQ